MPPLEAFKALCSILLSWKVGRRKKPLKIGIFDISREHFYAVLDGEVYVELPEEERKLHPGKDVVGLLKKSWYGLQDASQNWQGDYTDLIIKEGEFKVGKSSIAIFYRPKDDSRM